jgi:hypothetical protein
MKNSQSEEDGGCGSGSGIRYIISHILYKDQIKYLKAEGWWPSHDPEFADDSVAAERIENDKNEASLDDSKDGDSTGGEMGGVASADERAAASHGSDKDDGIVYSGDGGAESDDSGGDLFVNTNRVAALRVDDSSSSSSGSSSED